MRIGANLRVRGLVVAPMLMLFVMSLLAGCASDTGEQAEETPPAPHVTTAIVELAATSDVLQAAGTVRYMAETSLGFTTPGKIATIRPVAGERVSRGQLLAALDTTTVSADFAAAQAELERAQAELGRIAALFDQGWVTKAQLEQSEAAAKAARARVSSARFARETSRITAPSDGIILARNAEPGQIVQAGLAILILGEESRGLVFEVPVADADVAQLSIGMPATIRLAALGGEGITAQIRDIDGRADPLSGTFTVSFALPNSAPGNAQLRSGQIGTAQISMPRRQGGDEVKIPSEALFDVRADEAFVYVLEESRESRIMSYKAVPRNVTIGALLDDEVVIRAGLRPGERIIVTGHQDVQPQDIVAISNRSPAVKAKAQKAKQEK